MNKTNKILLSFFLILISGMGYSQSVPSYVPTNGLVGWWGFNGNAQDGSGNDNHGTVNGATLTTDRFGNLNGAYDFDGINDYIQTNFSGPQGNSPRTVSIWFKTSQLHTLNPIPGYLNEQMCLVSYGNSSYAGGTFDCSINHNCQGVTLDVAGGLFTRPSVTNNNLWHNLIFVYDGLNYQNVFTYYDGIMQQTSLFCAGTSHPINTGNSYPITFANYANVSTGIRHFNGSLDDIGIWNRALTPQEITNLYNSQLPTQTSLCLPTITTSSPSSVGVDTVVIGGDISNDGGSSIVLRGVCYSTSPNPNMGNQRTEDGSGTGSFNTVLRGLTSSTTYYARSYAKNSNDVVVYGNEVSFTTTASLPGVRCPGTPTVTDIDGNIYNTVQIGNQCWTQSNLKTSRYRNGDNIPTGLTNSAWENTTSGAYAIYNNDPVNDSLYGKLYNHYAVTDSMGLCPTGWHVPTDGEWNVMVKYLDPNSDTGIVNWWQGGVAGGLMKSTATQPTPGGWNLPNVGATNTSGYTGLPGGGRDVGGGFFNLDVSGFWWSYSLGDSGDAFSRILDINYADVLRSRVDLKYGYSVRCLKNILPQVNTTSVTNVTPSTALVTGEVISEGDQNTIRGFCYSTTPNPTIQIDTTINGIGLGVYTGTLQNLTPSTTYYVRAYATNSVGTSYGSELNFTTDSLPGLRCPGTPTVTDIDGNIYNTVQIGNQCWTQSNLKVSKYRNGDTIPNFIGNTAWSQTNTSWTGAWCNYDNISANDALYGKLYNWYAVEDLRGICPSGWHVPSDAEWTTLENHLGGPSVAGGALTSTLTLPNTGGWASPNTGATNLSGFTALPGGLRSLGGIFDYVISNGAWWSATEQSMSNVWRRNLQESYIWRYSDDKSSGFSVRCLKNTLPQVNTTSVTNVTPSTALVTGEVISEGDQNTTRGFCYSTTSNPTLSNDTTMNGTGIGAYSDTLQNLNPLTTYYVRAYATNSLGTSYGSELNFTTDSIRIGSNYAGGIVFYIDSTAQHGLVCAPVNQNSSPHFQWAISSCNDLILNGYSDWVLPSIYDLGTMYNNLQVTGLVDFTGNFIPFYWSSTIGFNNRAILLDFWSGIWNSNYPTSNWYQVRAIRSF